MKKVLSVILVLMTGFSMYAQDEIQDPPPGVVSARIFTHINTSLDRDNPSTGFEVRRAYFGYERGLSDNWSGKVLLDIGSINEDSDYALIRRYTYFKNAYLSYAKGNIRTWFGLFGMLQFKEQERFWGYRYLYRSFMDEYKFGSSADLGAGIQYSPSDKFTTDLVISNGEGYKKSAVRQCLPDRDRGNPECDRGTYFTRLLYHPYQRDPADDLLRICRLPDG